MESIILFFVFEMKKKLCFLVCFLLTSIICEYITCPADQSVESSSFSPVLLHFQWRTPKPILKTTSEEEEEDYVSLMQDFHDFSESQGEDVFSAEELLIVSGNFIAQEEDFLASVDIPEARKQHISTVLQNNHHGKKTYLLQNATDTPVLVFWRINFFKCSWYRIIFDAPDAEVRFPNSPALFRMKRMFLFVVPRLKSTHSFFSKCSLPMLLYPVLADIQEDNDDIVFPLRFNLSQKNSIMIRSQFILFLQEHIT